MPTHKRLPLDERTIVRDLKQLGQRRPSSTATRRAIARAVEALDSTSEHPSHPLPWRLLMHSSLAAALIAIVSLLVITWSQDTVSAADHMAAVAEANAAYEGWLHHTTQIEIVDRALVDKRMEGRGDANVAWPVKVESYHHTTTGERGSVTRTSDGHVVIELMQINDRLWSVYDSKGNQLRISVMSEDMADSMMRARKFMPWSAEGLIELWRNTNDFEQLTVQTREEDGLHRFDITFEQPIHSAEGQPPAFRPGACVLWVDPQTRLIQRSQATMQGVRFTTQLNYGDPAIRDIYDLGVPRDAIVTDNRTSDNLEQIYHAIEAAKGEGIGDYIALLTDVELQDDGQPDTRFGSVKVLASRDPSWLGSRYLLGSKTDPTE
jgi:hypothetical protein